MSKEEDRKKKKKKQEQIIETMIMQIIEKSLKKCLD